MRRLTIVALGVLGLDLLTKAIVIRTLPVHGLAVNVLGDLVRWIHVRNYGSAFGLFQGGRFFFIGFSLLSILLIVALARLPRYRTPIFGVSLGLILGGALGNLIDRIAFGAVTDFIDVGIGLNRWPTFNVADMGVSIGVCMLAVLLLREPHGEEAAGDSSSSDAQRATGVSSPDARGGDRESERP